MATKFGDAREIIMELYLRLPSADTGTGLGKLTANFLYSWGADGRLMDGFECLPSNGASWMSDVRVIVRTSLIDQSASTGFTMYATHSFGASTVKNATGSVYACAGFVQVWRSVAGFRFNGTIPIGAGSTIKIYARE